MVVIIKEDHSHPVTCVMLAVKAGLSSEGQYTGSGISHFVEHMIFKGTSKRKPGQIEKEVKSYGGVTNALTGLDSTIYYVTVPSDYSQKALELADDMIFHPAFSKDEVSKEKEVILKEIKLNLDDPSRRIMKALWQTAYLDHPYKMPVIGYEDLFKKLTREDLMAYHSARYTPNNSVLVVAGDVNANEMLAKIKSLFGKYERGGGLDISVPREPEQNSKRQLEEHAEINLGYLAMGYHTVELVNNDLYALDVLGIILGDWDNSRLNKTLVKDKELLYTVSSFNYTPKYPGLFIIYGVGSPTNLKAAKDAVLLEIEEIKKSGIDEAELEAAKNMVVSGYMDSLQTTNGLARMISQSELLTGDPLFFEKYIDGITKVDQEEIRRVAKKYLNINNLTLSYLYPNYEAKTSDASKEVLLFESDRNLPTKTVLSNGIRLILKEDRRIPKVTVVCAFLGGLRVETENDNGISNLLSSMLLKGTKNRKEDQIKAALEMKGGKISSFSGKNSFGLSLSFLSNETESALEVLEDVLENPTFPPSEIEKKKEKIYAAIKSQDDDIYDSGFLKLRKTLFSNYPYGMRVLGENASVKAITREQLKNFHKKFCVSDNMVITVVGDFETEKMKRLVENHLRDMNRQPLEIEPKKPSVFSGTKDMRSDMSREQSLVVIGFRGVTVTDKKRYSLQILSSILSGENGRLHKSIRNDMGLSYAQGAFSSPGIDTGYFASFVATDKKHLEKAHEILTDVLKSARSGDITDEEIALAKKSLIGTQKIALQTHGSLAHTMVLDELYGVGYKTYLDYPEYIKNVKKDEIILAAQKYIDLENCAVIRIVGKNNEE